MRFYIHIFYYCLAYNIKLFKKAVLQPEYDSKVLRHRNRKFWLFKVIFRPEGVIFRPTSNRYLLSFAIESENAKKKTMFFDLTHPSSHDRLCVGKLFCRSVLKSFSGCTGRFKFMSTGKIWAAFFRFLLAECDSSRKKAVLPENKTPRNLGHAVFEFDKKTLYTYLNLICAGIATCLFQTGSK